MTKLNEIPVLFNQEDHTYWNKNTFQELKGITSTLLRRLFPDKYKDIPKAILAKAAERGSNVHEDIELAETLGTAPVTEEGKNYVKLKEGNGLTFLASEHLVSDLEHYASAIDSTMARFWWLKPESEAKVKSAFADIEERAELLRRHRKRFLCV